MIRFTFKVQAGVNGFVFSMEDPDATNDTPIENQVMQLVVETAKLVVNQWAISVANEGVQLVIQDFEGPNKDELSREVRKRLLGHDSQEK